VTGIAESDAIFHCGILLVIVYMVYKRAWFMADNASMSITFLDVFLEFFVEGGVIRLKGNPALPIRMVLALVCFASTN